MSVVSIETTPQEFPVVNHVGVFNVNDVIKLEGPKGNLSGVVHSVSQKNFGNPPVPGLVLRVAINRGDLSEFKNGGFADYLVKGGAGAQGSIRNPCALKFIARLMKDTELQKMLLVAESLIAKAATLKSDGYARLMVRHESDQQERTGKNTSALRITSAGGGWSIYSDIAMRGIRDPGRHI